MFTELFALAHAAVRCSLELKTGCTGGSDGPFALDCTAGNGHDTLFLAESVGETGQVLALDIQESALHNTRKRLSRSGLEHRVLLKNISHADIAGLLPEGWAGNLRAVMYNLGFLPHGAHRSGSPLITTSAAVTLSSLQGLPPLLSEQAIVSIHCYAGHPGGAEETAAVAAWCSNLPWDSWRVARYEFCNKIHNNEILFLLHKL